LFHGLKSFWTNLMSEIKVGDLVRHNVKGYIDEIGLVVKVRNHNEISVMWDDGKISNGWSGFSLELVSDEQT